MSKRGADIPGEYLPYSKEISSSGQHIEARCYGIGAFRNRLLSAAKETNIKEKQHKGEGPDENDTQPLRSKNNLTGRIKKSQMERETGFGKDSNYFLIRLSDFNRRLKRNGDEIQELLMIITSDISFQHCQLAGIKEEMVLYLDNRRILELYKISANKKEGAVLSAEDIKSLGIKFKLRAIRDACLSLKQVKELIRQNLVSKREFVSILKNGRKLRETIKLLKSIGIMFTERDLSGLSKNPLLMKALCNAGLVEKE